MKLKCIESNVPNLKVGEIYRMQRDVDGFGPTVEHENNGRFFLNGKDNLAVNVGSFVLAKFEVVE
ncbi:hypothetical protein FKF61_21540 [Salmonella enterica]|uniref:Uncharacterized protein n=1 Tax=Salmonella phage F61 TaxID=2982033 RepID=A0A977WM16_9CAUD|nr:hypothetical protein [Salmonella enterica]QIN92560.1 hypothetical protein [Phage NBSal001]UXM05333.1 hypothetical protein [Salmonella phage F115]UXM05395.1 hypothetical protein [Salmonella phage F61]HBI4576226.1 hypothetical protein [Salmonella enterica subsp. enterica serovar Infantis]